MSDASTVQGWEKDSVKTKSSALSLSETNDEQIFLLFASTI